MVAHLEAVVADGAGMVQVVHIRNPFRPSEVDHPLAEALLPLAEALFPLVEALLPLGVARP